MLQLRMLFTALVSLLVLFTVSLVPGDVYAQEAGQVKTLEELMREVDQIAPHSEESEGVSSIEDTPSGVKTLEELMREVQGASDDDSSHTTISSEHVTDAQPSSPPPKKKSGPSFWFLFGIFALVVSCIALGVPLYVLIGSLTMYLLYFGGIFNDFTLLTSIIEQTRGLSDQTVLLAIPFFVIAGAIMTEGDIARRLISFAESIFGRLPGGLGIAAVFACAFFAAISGSSPVTVIAIGSIMYPALVKKGYPENFSCGLVTSAGSLGILIPPSIPMIVYAIVDPTGLRDPVGYSISSAGGGESSVKDLFIAGLVPGLLIGIVFALYAMYIGWKRRVPTKPFNITEVWSSFRDGFWALFLPVLILGGIYSGVFTPTQAAGVAVVYALIVELFIHRSLTLESLPKVFTESAVLMGSLLIIMALALGFNLYLDRAKIPEAAVQMILDYQMSILTFLLIVNILLIFVGFFMDILSAILILVPLLAPIAFGLGIHPLHFAAIFIVNLEIGYLSPPIGLNLFVSGTLFKKGIGTVVRSVLPFISLMIFCLLLVTYVPTISLGLVSWSKGGDFYVPFPSTSEAQVEEVVDLSPDAQQTPPIGEVKTLDELMRSVDSELPSNNDAASGERVKTLEELMREVEKQPDSLPSELGEPTRVKTLEELMLEVEQQGETGLP